MNIFKQIYYFLGKKRQEEPVKFNPEEKKLLEEYIEKKQEQDKLIKDNKELVQELGKLIQNGTSPTLINETRNAISARTKKIQEIRRWMIEKNGFLKKALTKKGNK